MAPSVPLGSLQQPFDLGLRQVFAGVRRSALGERVDRTVRISVPGATSLRCDFATSLRIIDVLLFLRTIGRRTHLVSWKPSGAPESARPRLRVIGSDHGPSGVLSVGHGS
jgi:hypothetical protein